VGEGRGSLQGSPRKHPKRDFRGAGEGVRPDRRDKRGKEERNGCMGGRIDRQTDRHAGRNENNNTRCVALGP